MAAAIAIFSGVVRGFSGFGSALIYIPLTAAVYDPLTAAVTFVMIDLRHRRQFRHGRVAADALGRSVAARRRRDRLGAIRHAHPAICRSGAAALDDLRAGRAASSACWSRAGAITASRISPVTIAVGLFAGVLGGAVQISGPPIVIYWLGSMHDVGIVRASLISYFGLFSAGSVVTYYFHGLLTATLDCARDPARPAACRRHVGRRQGVSSRARRRPTGASPMS